MVKKLFKHEFIALGRVMVLVYAAVLLVATLGRMTQFLENDGAAYAIVSTFSIMTYVITISGAFTAWLVFTLVRFYKHLFTSEGYLTLTLPVTPTQHVCVKALTALLFGVITFAVVLLSGCVMTAGELLVEIWRVIVYVFNDLYKEVQWHSVAFLAELAVWLLVMTLAEVLLYDMFLAIGQLFRKARILAAIGAYFSYYLITEIFSTILFVLFAIFSESPAFEALAEFIGNHPCATLHIVFGVLILSSAVMAVVCFLVTRHIVTKKLNLE